MPDLIIWTNRRLAEMRREMDEIFRGLESELRPTLPGPALGALSVQETDTAILVRAELPGYAPNDISVLLRGDLLVIEGKRSVSAASDEEASLTRTDAFSRRMRLPCKVLEEQVEAVHREGTLTISLPKCPEKAPRRIPIKGEQQDKERSR
jgi:HSP20 family protein